jgi:alpha-D-ribose 1-methylphosphonate 5-triphosphate synthase subunit PhnH
MTSQLLKRHNFDDVFDSQSVFRLVLEAMSNPSRIVNINKYADKLFGENKSMLALGMTLLDTNVSFNTCENPVLSDDLFSLTFSRRDKVSNADFIFICNPSFLPDVIANSKCGTLADPHKSATLIVRNIGKEIYNIDFCGPGINGKISVMVSEVVKNALAFRDRQSYEYPQGIDFIFTDETGQFFAIPRSTHMEVQ